MTSSMIGRLTAPVAALAFLLLVLAVGSAWYVHSLQKSASDLIASNVASMKAAQELEISLREARTQYTRYLITQDEGHLKLISRQRERTAEALAAAERAASTSDEQRLMKRVRGGYEHFFTEYDHVTQTRTEWKYPKILELDEVFEKEILEPAREYLRLNEGVLTNTTAANQQTADRITTALLAIGLSGAVGGVLAGTLIAVAIRRSLLSAEEQVRRTATELGQAVPHRPESHASPAPADPVEQMRQSASAVLARLRQTERDALRAEQLAWVGQMAAGLAHEVRNPLMAIKLLVQAAAERRDGAAFRGKDLRVLEEEILRLEQIVSGFLDFARPPRFDPRPVDVKTLAERAVDGVRARADLQTVTVRVEGDPGPAVVSADANQVRQVMLNLLFNALDAQPDGGHVTVRVGMDRRPGGEPEVVVAVADGGPGLPPDLSEQVFEPFVSTKESGLGLGLSICRRIAETHGGELTAVSSPAGTTFTLRLPVVPPPHPAALSA